MNDSNIFNIGEKEEDDMGAIGVLATEQARDRGQPYISEIDIKEFRGIRQCEKPIPLTKFTVFVGRNNSGKSSILEATSLFYRPMDSYYLPYYDKSIIKLLKSLHNSERSLIYGYAGEASLQCMLLQRKIKMELSTNGHARNIEINNKAMQREEYISEFDKSFLKNPNSPYFLPIMLIPNNTLFLHELFKNIRNNPENREYLAKTGANVRIVDEFINNIVDDRYTEILTDSQEFRIRKEYKDKILYIHMDDLGEGIKKVTSIALSIELYDPRIILWDDFEGAAHFSLIKKLIQWLSKKDRQVIISTHSIDVLNALIEVKPKGTSVLLTKKTPDDILISKSYSIDDFEELMYTNTDPRLVVDSLGL